MVIRPVDEDGDILPVLSPVNLLKGVKAETELIRDRLHLLSGDWWENPFWGNAALDMLKENRYTIVILCKFTKEKGICNR